MTILAKQIFLVTSEQLCAYQWERGRLTDPVAFSADRAGMDAFAHYLRYEPGRPAYVIADMVEEEFQRQLLPHVRGRSRRGLVERRLALLFRDTPFRMALVQGREAAGRRDDIYLFSALTNPHLLQPWLKVIEHQGVPLAAVYSSTFLSLLLVRRLALVQPHLLLITHEAGGLRQTYFQGRHIKFSRLTKLAPGDTLAEVVAEETDRMRQFLTSSRLTGRGDVLRVVVLAPAADIPALEAECEDEPEIAFNFIDMQTAAARVGVDMVPQLADRLLLSLVGKRPPASHFPTGKPGRLFKLWQTRLGLHVAAAAIAASAAAWTVASVWLAVNATSETKRLAAATPQYESRYNAVMASVPPVPTRTANMKAAVTVEQMVRTSGPRPGPLTAIVSAALDRAPAVRINALEWRIRQTQGAAPVQSPVVMGQPSDAPPQLYSADLGIPTPPVQTLHIDGEIDVPQNSSREVLSAMNAFAYDLARNPRVAVEILNPPLDVRPNARLSGKAGLDAPQGKPKFVMRLTWAP
ncbi:MAG TPA: hypothetical protein VFT37_15880 [Telluria sp.]|nr:hypothetical protein [Telluria sp.]